MSEARTALSGNWGHAALLVLVYVLVTGAASVIPFGSLIVGGPLMLGLVIVSKSLAEKGKPEFSLLFKGFNKFLVSLTAMLLVGLFTILWGLLLIIPGIIGNTQREGELEKTKLLITYHNFSCGERSVSCLFVPRLD